jgi:hypothetical protein
MEKIMSTERELTSDELDLASGGGNHIPNVIIEDVGGGGGSGGSGITPAGAWNACLGVFNYPALA